MERTFPYSENKACTVSSVASLGKFPTKIRFKRHVLNSGGELIDRASRVSAATLRVMCRVACQKVRKIKLRLLVMLAGL